VFIHYALLVAYISRVGQLAAETVRGGFGVDVSDGAAGTAYAAILGYVIFASSPRRLDDINSVLVGIVLLTFAPLLVLGAANVDVQNFATGDWTAVPSTIPVIALAFVFHNVVPVVATSLEGDARKAKVALMAGTAIPFAMFVLWDAALLGSVSQAQAEDALDAVARSGGAIEAIADPLAALQATSPAAAALVSGFSFFAITTSFVGFVLGLVDFLSDGLGFRAEESETKTQKGNDWRPFLLTLLPPWAFALSYPDVFLDALDSAGTFGVLTLFGCMPPAMAWSNRYGGFGNANNAKGDKGSEWKENQSEETRARLLPGGKPALLLCFSLAAGVVLTESVQRVGYLLFDR
jgi:tyrosine-specific transport protein